MKFVYVAAMLLLAVAPARAQQFEFFTIDATPNICVNFYDTNGESGDTTGTPSADIYEEDTATEIVNDSALAKFDTKTGMYCFKPTLSAANGFEVGKRYTVAVTCDAGNSCDSDGRLITAYVKTTFLVIAGAAPGYFPLNWASINAPTTTQNLSGTSTKALEPTVAGRTLDVAATGEAGLDLGNTTGTIEAAEIATDAITAAKVAADTFGASEIAADAFTADEFAADVRTELVGSPAGASVSADIAAMLASMQQITAVRKATSFQWGLKFYSSTTHIDPGGSGITPTCTRSIDAPMASGGTATTNTASAINSLGWSELTISTSDINGDHYMALRCTATGADPYETIFKIQVP